MIGYRCVHHGKTESQAVVDFRSGCTPAGLVGCSWRPVSPGDDYRTPHDCTGTGDSSHAATGLPHFLRRRREPVWRAARSGRHRTPSPRRPHPRRVLQGRLRDSPATSARWPTPSKDAGIATWNIEYRRLGETGSGWPGTYLDVGRAVDHVRAIAGEHHLDLGRVAVVGHSAGGHLAMWTAARRRLTEGK